MLRTKERSLHVQSRKGRQLRGSSDGGARRGKVRIYPNDERGETIAVDEERYRETRNNGWRRLLRLAKREGKYHSFAYVGIFGFDVRAKREASLAWSHPDSLLFLSFSSWRSVFEGAVLPRTRRFYLAIQPPR